MLFLTWYLVIHRWINYGLDQDALKFTIDDRINYLYGQPIRFKGRTYRIEPVITKELWELLNDLNEKRK